MEFEIIYKIIPEYKVIISCVKGEIEWKDVLEFKRRLTKDEAYDPTFNILDDISDLFVHLNDKKEIQEFIDFASNISRFIGIRKSAVITSSPNQVVNVELLSSLNMKLPVNFRAFSTVETALSWIGFSGHDHEHISNEHTLLKSKLAL